MKVSKIDSILIKQVKLVLDKLMKDLVIYELILLIVFFGMGLCYFLGYTNKINLFSYFSVIKLLLVPSLILFIMGYLFVVRPDRPILYMVRKVKELPKYVPDMISGILLLSAISVFTSTYSSIKSLIPIIHPFDFDSKLHYLDSKLFFGIEPWRLILNDNHSPYVTGFLNFSYNLWFVLVWWTLLFFVFRTEEKCRSQYLMSFVLCWFVIGNVMAILLSSAGPAFVSHIYPNNSDYLPLMKILNQDNNWLKTHNPMLSIWALKVQNELWESYSTSKDMLGSGISAMPSMHVSMAVLMTLSISSMKKNLRYVLWIFVLIIYIGSFTLGWHYAVDGLVSTIVTYLIWIVSGFVVSLNLGGRWSFVTR